MYLKTLLTLLLLCVLKIHTKSIDSHIRESSCGYESCHPVDPDALNIHLIPHSHDDLGWLKTVDQYFYQDVQTVISSVVGSLDQNPDRRFIQVETAYLNMWWRTQSNTTKETVRNLINTGRLEIINGGWCMNDEANVMYQETVDQYTLGLRFLEDEFGACARPRASWQIDTFGHSKEQASIMARLGFDSVFFMRMDYRDKEKRLKDKTSDLIWSGSGSLNDTDIFTSIFYGAYSFPASFCFDHECNDEPFVVDEESPDYNYQRRVEEFADFVREKAQMYPTNNLLVVMGDDVRYQASEIDYINLDRLIKGFELFPQTFNDKPIKVLYSTPSCYTKAVNDYVTQNDVNLDVKTDDFLPYATDGYGYWAGFFVSRPATKRYIRQANNLLQVAKQLATYNNEPYDNENIKSLKEAVAVMQHHDAITGTEKLHVMKDYTRLIHAGISNVDKEVSRILTKIITDDDSAEDYNFDSCILKNVSSCAPSKSDKFFVVAYNPLSKSVTSPVTIPVDSDSWKITDPQGGNVENQVVEQIKDFSYIDDVPLSKFELEFVAKDIPALGYNIYEFEKSSKISNSKQPRDVLVGFDKTHFVLDEASGLIKEITMNNVTMSLKQDIYYYESGSYSGAYIFVPANPDRHRVAQDKVETNYIFGEVYQAIEQKFNDWMKQVVKVYKDDQSFIEISWIVGPVDMSDGIGKEFISVFTTDLKSDGYFYTDSNGREMLQRKRNYRPTFEYTNEEPIAGNYHPITSRIVLKDEESGVEFAVLSDRAQGATSLNDGEVEVMFQRICPHEDRAKRGVRDSLNDVEYGQGITVRGRHYLIAGKSENLAAVQRDVALRKYLEPWTFVSNKNADSAKNKQLSGLTRDLPDNVNVLTLEPWKSDDDVVLLRFEHLLETGEDAALAQEVSIDVSDLFTRFSVVDLQETTLGANMLLEESSRLEWPGRNKVTETARDDGLTITLSPMQIRTFWAKITR